MKVEKVSPHIGARVSGVALQELGPDDRQMLRNLLEEHLVLFFLDQTLTDMQFRNYGKVVGELHRLDMLQTLGGDIPEVHIVEKMAGASRGLYTDAWHSDACYMQQPPYATTIMPAYLPAIGGDTAWASMYAAYELMSEPLQRLADELYVVQSGGVPEWTHPVVRVNPRSGRRGLYVNSVFSRQIVGMSRVESARVIDMFCQLATIPDVQVRYRWSPDTVAIWDNRFTQHYAINDYAEPRRMHRLSISGEPVLGLRDPLLAESRVAQLAD